MDGSVSKLRFAAKRLLPYYLRSRIELPKSNESINEVNRRIESVERDRMSDEVSTDDESDAEERVK